MFGVGTDEVEQELMELWSNVEKEKAAKQERTAARQAAGKDVGRRSESRGDEERLLLHAAGGGHPAGDRLPADSAAGPKGQGAVGMSRSEGGDASAGGHDTREGEAEQNGRAGPAGAGEPEKGGPTGREQEAAQQATLDAQDDSDGRAAVASAGTTDAGVRQLWEQLPAPRLAGSEASKPKFNASVGKTQPVMCRCADADVDRGGSAEEAQAGVDEAGVGLAEDMQGSIEPKLYRLLSTVPQARPSCIGQMPIKYMVCSTGGLIFSLSNLNCCQHAMIVLAADPGSVAYKDAVVEG